ISIFLDDPERQLDGATQLWTLLSEASGLMDIKQAIKSGTVPRFVDILRHSASMPQISAARVLATIASAHAKVVHDAQAVPALTKLLASPTLEVREQAVWAHCWRWAA
ncbi:hypothetical protein DXG01_013785, partial [Tephrocybe rancida]